MVFIICFIIAIISSFIGAIAGLGGGVILVPSMFLAASISDSFSWATPQTIVGISLITMIFTSLSSATAYMKSKRVDFQTGLLLLSGSIPGGVLGSWLNSYFSPKTFLIFFGTLVIVISLLMIVKKEKIPKRTGKHGLQRTVHIAGETYDYRISVFLAIILSLAVGILSGLFGIGGGSIMVPAMILLFGMPAHIATATSMFMIFFVSMIGSISHVTMGHIAWEYVLSFIPGAWIGGKLGAKVNQLLPGKTLEWVLRIILIFVGIRMIFQGIS